MVNLIHAVEVSQIANRFKLDGGAARGRTEMGSEPRQILSLLCLPIPPQRHRQYCSEPHDPGFV